MPNTVFQLRRNTVSGTRPTTSTVAPGELAINTTDGILFSANSTVVFEVGANNTSIAVGNNTSRFTVNATVVAIGNNQSLVANGSAGSAGQILASNGTGVYWAPASSSTAVRQTFVANATVNTTFTVTGGYTVGFVDVYKNGVKLINGTDVYVTSGSTVVLEIPAISGEVIDVVGALTNVVAVTSNNTLTLTNKRIDPRVFSTTSASSVTPDISSFDMYIYTALASGLTINATTGGSPVNGSKLTFRFKDNGTPRSLSWTTAGTNSFRVVGVTLPTTTVANKVTYVGCVYNSDESFWDVIAVTTQA